MQLIFFVVVASLFAGAVLVGVGVFFYVLLKSVKHLSAKVEAFHAMLQPVMEGKTLINSVNTIQSLSKHFGTAVQALQNHTLVLHEFNRIFLTKVYEPEIPAKYQAGV